MEKSLLVPPGPGGGKGGHLNSGCLESLWKVYTFFCLYMSIHEYWCPTLRMAFFQPEGWWWIFLEKEQTEAKGTTHRALCSADGMANALKVWRGHCTLGMTSLSSKSWLWGWLLVGKGPPRPERSGTRAHLPSQEVRKAMAVGHLTTGRWTYSKYWCPWHRIPQHLTAQGVSHLGPYIHALSTNVSLCAVRASRKAPESQPQWGKLDKNQFTW